jgi:hypothetical protein
MDECDKHPYDLDMEVALAVATLATHYMLGQKYIHVSS